ncbi:unnamed protein product [Meganyctiphanes norvegica]|uniref:Uncharacterized protein n=1 Tax=Meganyctiphanes norvegica TaxID=48144 RepID=A0AAV2RK28_MEGNR
MVDLAEKTVLKLTKIDTSVGDDNLGAMNISGSEVSFYHTTAETIGKGVLLGPFRMITGNTVQRCSYIVIYNCDDHTKKELKTSFTLNNTYMSLNRVQNILKECKKSYSREPRRREDYTYNGHSFNNVNLVGLVGFELWLADD